ncbi:MAG: hypothetical protein N2321_00460 [Melioribacteraceae bacterium]|nr:hypothetical protein [Melioribacteraceae bacterium]
MKNKLLLLLLIVFLISCDNNENKNITDNYKNLNVTILIDLSDRISLAKHPDQSEKDINIISSVVDNFKNFLSRKGVVNSDDKIKVIFYPTLNYEIYQSICDSLNIDFSTYEFHQRKKIYNSISQLYNKNLSKLYSLASKAKTFEGSDIFNYFKHRVVDDCIINDSNYINVLVLLTDGYIYYKNCKDSVKNRFSYILPESYQIKRFRKSNNWEDYFNKNDFGLIKIDNDLSNLNILVAEIDPIHHSPKDFDIIKKYLSKWFDEQKVDPNNYKILKTDLTSINKNLVNNYFEKIFMR